MKKSGIIMFILSFVIILTNSLTAQSIKERADSVLPYKNGKDSIRIVFKKNRISKTTTYFPSGKQESRTVNIKEKYYKRTDTRQVKFKYISWNEEGEIIKKSRGNMKTRGFGHKDVVWIFRENGKKCFKRKQIGWTTKY